MNRHTYRLLIANIVSIVVLGLVVLAQPSYAATVVGAVPAAPVGTQFVYEGRLGTLTGVHDLQFRLFDAATGGTLVGTPSINLVNDRPVTQGQYLVTLNFGAAAFSGDARFLEVGHRPGTSTGAYTIQSPRQPILPAAYALSLRPGATIKGTIANPGAVLQAVNTGTGAALQGSTTTGTYGVHGLHDNPNGGAGVQGRSTKWYGVRGDSVSGQGVWGQSQSSSGTVGVSITGTGIYGQSRDGIGVYGESTNGYAAVFQGKTATKILEIQGGSDLAERFEVDGTTTVAPGTLMVIDATNPGKLKVSDQPYDSKVAGVISGAGGVNPGLTLHQENVMEGDHTVAIAGRVYVKAEAISGAIEPGDLLTTSSIPGHAMHATDRDRAYGTVVGKALTGLDTGTGLVLVLVNLQ